MKKFLTVASAVLLTAGLVQAQADKAATTDEVKTTTVEAVQVTTEKADDASAKCDMKNCCIKKEGRMYRIKDGKEIPMDSEMTLKDGTVVSTDGTCLYPNGKKMMMKEGECIDMSGKSCLMRSGDKARPEPSR